MRVPADWTPDPVFRPDSPFTSLVITVPSDATRRARMPTPAPPTFRPLLESEPPIQVPRPYLSLIVSHFEDDDLDLGEVTRRSVRRSCFLCSPDVRDVQGWVDVHGRAGTLTDVLRADGSRHWTLVTQNQCDTYVVDVSVRPGHVEELAETVERVLASFSVEADGGLFGRC